MGLLLFFPSFILYFARLLLILQQNKTINMEKMRKWSLLVAIVGWGLMVTSCSQSEEADDLVHGPSIQMVTAEKFEMSNKTIFTRTGDGQITRFQALMPLPQSNIYQTVKNVSYNEGRVLLDMKYGNKALFVNRGEFVNSEYVMETVFDVYTKKVAVDLSKITSFQAYNPNSDACKRFLGDRGEYVVTSNPYIVKTGDRLWAESENVLDYARRCYEYVAANFSYIKGSWRTLEKILEDGGGECGDFSTLVVNLLRYKGIPSRHNICVTFKGGYHVWVDFYIEGFGWIPLDATYKNNNPKGDFFGKYDGECIIVAQDLCYDFDLEDRPIDALQTYYYWYNYDGGECEITGTHLVQKIKKLDD